MFRSQDQQNFHKLVLAHISRRDGPLLIEGGTGLGKTRAYLAAVMQAALTGQRIAVVLPTHQLIDQLLASQDLAVTQGECTVFAFRPARMFETRADYERNKQTAIESQVMFCTAASVIIDQRLAGEYNGSTQRDYIVFDEADQLPDMAALQSDFSVTAQELQDLSITLTDPKQALEAILAKKTRTVEPEIRAAAKVILEAMEEPAWYQNAGVDDEGNIVLTHKLPGRLLKKISNQNNVAFVSATLTIGGKFNDFTNAMGITQPSGLSSVIEPQKHGQLEFFTQQVAVDTPEWIDAIVNAVNKAQTPVLVATPSHELSALLGQSLPNATVRKEDETPAQAAARCSGVLIAAGAWAGLDTPLRWRSIVVPRVPYGQPVVIDGEITTSYLDARNTAVRRLRQVIGRGLRSPDAQCAVYFLDDRVERLKGFIPERFVSQWTGRVYLEGGRKPYVLSKAERDPAVRNHALRHYGAKCMACQFQPKVLSQLEVHHLDPIAEGVRKTRIEDVAVLCANCHRLAHSEDPPLTVGQIISSLSL